MYVDDTARWIQTKVQPVFKLQQVVKKLCYLGPQTLTGMITVFFSPVDILASILLFQYFWTQINLSKMLLYFTFKTLCKMQYFYMWMADLTLIQNLWITQEVIIGVMYREMIIIWGNRSGKCLSWRKRRKRKRNCVWGTKGKLNIHMHYLFFISYYYPEARWEKEKWVFLPREWSAFHGRWAVATTYVNTYSKCSIEWLHIHKDLTRCNSSFWQTNCLIAVLFITMKTKWELDYYAHTGEFLQCRIVIVLSVY